MVELGSINRAAVDLHISQPALSRQIQLLESELGAALLHRTSAGVTLTQAGATLFEGARGILRTWERLRSEVSGVAQGQVSLGFPHSWRHITTLPLAEHLIEARGISGRVHEAVSRDLRRQLSQGLLDLCVASDDGTALEGCHRIPLAGDPVVLVGADRSDLPARGSVSPQMLSELPLILLARPNSLRSELEHIMAAQSLTLKVLLETDSLSTCLDLVASGAGMTVLPACSLVGEEHRRLSWVGVEGLRTDWTVYVSSSRADSRPFVGVWRRCSGERRTWPPVVVGRGSSCPGR